MKTNLNPRFAASVVMAIVVTGVLAGFWKRPQSSFLANGSSGSSGGKAATMLEIVTGQTRHFKGSPEAPVTILEFSDFQ